MEPRDEGFPEQSEQQDGNLQLNEDQQPQIPDIQMMGDQQEQEHDNLNNDTA